jgi:hypothetical protein
LGLKVAELELGLLVVRGAFGVLLRIQTALDLVVAQSGCGKQCQSRILLFQSILQVNHKVFGLVLLQYNVHFGLLWNFDVIV